MGEMSKTTERAVRYVDAGGRNLPVALVEDRRATRLTLRIMPGTGGLRLSMPPRVSDSQIDAFLSRNLGWIRTRLDRMPEPVEAVNGAVIPFRGVDHRVRATGTPRGVVHRCSSPHGAELVVPGPTSATGRRLRDFFRKEARILLNEAVHRHAEKLEVRPKSIRITDSRSRWGSCSTTRTLSFSWRIVMAPPAVLEYLAAHETAHLREMNHGPRFWALVRELCPQLEQQKNWLRRHGNQLHAIRLD